MFGTRGNITTHLGVRIRSMAFADSRPLFSPLSCFSQDVLYIKSKEANVYSNIGLYTTNSYKAVE